MTLIFDPKVIGADCPSSIGLEPMAPQKMTPEDISKPEKTWTV
jgi:hypothetical protein